MRTRKNIAEKKEVLYPALDVEATGPVPAIHGLLSVGACITSRERLSYEEYVEKGLVFYAELKPTTYELDEKGMRVGCSHLACLESMRHDPRYDPKHAAFDPRLVLEHMARVCEEPAEASARFRKWLNVGANRQARRFTTVQF